MTRSRKPTLVKVYYTLYGDLYAQDAEGHYWRLDWQSRRLMGYEITWLKRQQRYELLTQAPEKVVRKLNKQCVFTEEKDRA